MHFIHILMSLVSISKSRTMKTSITSLFQTSFSLCPLLTKVLSKERSFRTTKISLINNINGLVSDPEAIRAHIVQNWFTPSLTSKVTAVTNLDMFLCLGTEEGNLLILDCANAKEQNLPRLHSSVRFY